MKARLYFDANVFIEIFETKGETASGLAKLFGGDGRPPRPIVTSELTLSEILVHPIRMQDDKSVARYARLIETKLGFLSVVPVTRAILLEAAYLRAGSSGLRLPDAIHLATALSSDCDILIPNDRRLSRVTIEDRNRRSIQIVDFQHPEAIALWNKPR